MQVLAVALDPPEDAGVTYTLLNRYLFVGKEDLRLPTAFLLNAQGDIVKAYRDPIVPADVAADVPHIEASPAERLARAAPFPGTFHVPPGARNDLQYGMELVEQGQEDAALPAFERAARGDPSAFTLYSLGTLYMKSGQPGKAKDAFERALRVKPDFPRPATAWAPSSPRAGTCRRPSRCSRRPCEATPDYPDALNNLGYALLQSGREQEAFELYQKALKLQPDFPEAFNNLGIFHARQGEMARAASPTSGRPWSGVPDYGEAGNNLALVLMAGDDPQGAMAVLQRLLELNPAFEMTLRDAGQDLPGHGPAPGGRAGAGARCCSGTRPTPWPARSCRRCSSREARPRCCCLGAALLGTAGWAAEPPVHRYRPSPPRPPVPGADPAPPRGRP